MSEPQQPTLEIQSPLTGMPLVLALSGLGAQLQQASPPTTQALLQTAGQGLASLGYQLVLTKVDGPLLLVAHVAARDAAVSLFEQLLQQPILGLAAPLEMLPVAMQALTGHRFVYSEDLLRDVMHFISRFPELERFHTVLADSVYQRGVLCPIFARDRAWGFITVCSATLSQEDVPALGLFASQLAAAIASAEAHAALENRGRNLASIHAIATAVRESELERLLPRLLRIAAESTQSDRAAIYLLKPDRPEELVLAGTHGYKNPLMERHSRLVVGTALPEVTQSLWPRALNVRQWPESFRADLRAEGMEETALLPLHLQRQPAGCLLLSRASPLPYTEEDLGFCRLLADQIAIQVESSRLYTQAKRKVQHLSLLFAIARLGTEARELEPLMQDVIKQAIESLQVDGAVIHLLRDGRLELASLQLASPWDTDKVVASARELPLDDQTLVGRAATTKQVVSGMSDLGARLGARYAAAAPLVAKDQVVGTFMVVRRASRPFATDELELFENCAAHVGVALEQVRLYDDLKRSYNELAQAQAELVRRTRLAAVGELAALVAHEVRNPLAVIFNSLSTLRKLLKPGGDVQMLLDIVGEEADRLNRMVGEFLDFARPNEPMLQPELLEEVMSDAVEAATSTHESRAVQVRLDIPSPIAPVPCDARLLRQALINLVANAIQAMPRGGHITVRATEERHRERACARVDVIDDGPGIPPSIADRLFEPFFTTKASGTGLGLAVVKRIIEAHHGEIEVQSTPGQGATFTLRIPSTPETPDPVLAPPAP